MDFKNYSHDYDNLKDKGTGSHDIDGDYKIIDYFFDKYLIKVKLTPFNEFIGIVEVKLNKDFLSYKQKNTSQGYHDVEEFYKE